MVTVDRPPGSSHPDYPDTVNPVNCGYVDGVPGGDGKDQDVYVPGPDAPLRYFEGTVIAVYHRTDGSGDKWIVTEDGRDMTDSEILNAIRFQEKYFEGVLIRGTERSGT